MERTILSLLQTEAVIRCDKNCEDCLKILQFSRKTPAPTRQCRDIMAQISIDTFDCEGVIFIMWIEYVFTWKYRI